jgi:hypothetical protein
MEEKIRALLDEWWDEYWEIRNTSTLEALKLGECMLGLTQLLVAQSKEAQIHVTPKGIMGNSGRFD